MLTSLGLEVASVAEREVPEGVVAASVVAVASHPNADRLSLCRVTAGGEKELQVICGAPNVRVGMVAALAPEGCVLGDDLVVKKAKIRGVESRGMLCSERELGLSEEHAGIMELPADTTPGTLLKEIISTDSIIEIEITPNRGDCLSLLGVAREVRAKLGLPLESPALHPQEAGGDITKHITVSIDDPRGCPRYMGRLIRNVTIGESPRWLKERLRASGLRPINNIVDITNYILLLFGQPMHAFDYAKIDGKTIQVKDAEEGRTFVTLDDTERKLQAGDLMIWDGKRPVALAGIMGGADTEIGPDTKDVFLECAFFDPVTIRTTAKRLGLSTDSSYRFERGVDPKDGLRDALDTAAELMRQLAAAEVVSGVIDVFPRKPEPRRIPVRPTQVRRVLGVELSAAEIARMLQSLNIEKVAEEEGIMMFSPPAYRHDLAIEADLIEEVGRLYGYDNIPIKDQASVTITRASDMVDETRRKVREASAGLGLHEVLTNSITSEKIRSLLTPNTQAVELLNPLTPDMAQMRTTLLGSHLEVTARNINHRTLSSHLFEIGKVFAAREGTTLPREREVLAILLQGQLVPATWNTSPKTVSFYALKGVINALAGRLGLGDLEYSSHQDAAPHWCGYESARVSRESLVEGCLGIVREEILAAFGIAGPVYYAELDVTELLARRLPRPDYKPLPRYPAIERDFSFVVVEELHSAALVKEIYGASELIEAVEPFDLYRGEKVAEKTKSIAYTVRLRAPDRTLSDKEADRVADKIIGSAKRRYGAELRT
ncbi:MAG: phenylalanine--tRNA ligase subunit beta [Chitinivibrionales bacterium]|nr:phenylalanine--tRNA ligase subunit beta [Chitinivibrionales bacterium]MBD3357927.1 phenylalanine--tRNA ligase subunit beta [Chitinivibrionales bacterium]